MHGVEVISFICEDKVFSFLLISLILVYLYLNRLPLPNSRIAKSLKPTGKEWSDSLFYDDIIKCYAVNSRPNLELSVKCAKSFLNWYAYGSDIDDMSLMIAGLFGQATKPSSSDYLFSDVLFSSTSNVRITLPKCFSRITLVNKKLNSPINSEMKLWYNPIFDLLEANDEKKKAALNYLSYLVMTMMRYLKSPDSFYSRTPRISTDVVSIWQYTPVTLIGTPVPEDKVLKKKIHLISKRCLAFIIASYMDPSHCNINHIFTSSCLLSLKYIGLDCYRWALNAAEKLNCDINEILILPEFQEISNKIKLIHIRYIKELSWTWAGLFSRDWFKEFSLTENPKFCITMASVALGDDVTKVASFKKYDISTFQDAKVRAEKIRAFNQGKIN